MLLSGCRSQQVTSTATANHTAARLHRDSIYLHDSIVVTYILWESGSPGELTRMGCRSGDNVVLDGANRQSDTIFVEREKWHTRWRDRETIKTDTLTNEVIRTETVQVRYIPRFYKYCTALAIILFLICLLRVTLYLYRRFH